MMGYSRLVVVGLDPPFVLPRVLRRVQSVDNNKKKFQHALAFFNPFQPLYISLRDGLLRGNRLTRGQKTGIPLTPPQQGSSQTLPDHKRRPENPTTQQ